MRCDITYDYNHYTNQDYLMLSQQSKLLTKNVQVSVILQGT